MDKHAPEYNTYVNLLRRERARARSQYEELRQREEVISAKRQKVVDLEAERDQLQALLDFVFVPEADAEEIDEAKRVLRMLGNE